MEPPIRNLFTQILTIIGYANDKDTYIMNFLKACEEQSLIELIKILPTEKQQTINQQTTPEEIKTIIESNFTKEQIEQTLKTITEDLFSKYIEQIYSTLSEQQSQQLGAFLKDVKQSTISV